MLWSGDYILNHSCSFLWTKDKVCGVLNCALLYELLFEFIESIYNLRSCSIIVVVLHFITMQGLFSTGQIPKWQ